MILPCTLHELEDKFRKGEYVFYRNDTIVLVKNNNPDNTTVVTIYNHPPLQQFQKYFPPKI